MRAAELEVVLAVARARCGRSPVPCSVVTKSRRAAAARRSRSPCPRSGWRATVPASASPLRVATARHSETRASLATASASAAATTSRSPTRARLFSPTAATSMTRVVDLGAVGDRAVARDGPGRGGPDHDGGAVQLRPVGADDREAHPDRGRGVVVVLDLGLGQRGLLDHRPHHRLRALVEAAVQQELADLADDLRLGRDRPWSCRDCPSRPSRRGA